MTCPSADPPLYLCPGETRPVSRAVHLARLEAFHHQCRSCALRTDTGPIPKRTIRRLAAADEQAETEPISSGNRIRGIYQNQITAAVGTTIALRLAAAWHERSPRAGRIDPKRTPAEWTRPCVVVGHDQRASSPEILAGIVRGLTRGGCDVVDIGRSTGPCLQFAVRGMKSDGGLFVTGAGRAASWTGLDVFGPGGEPLPVPDGILHESLTDRPPARPTRSSGSHRLLDVTDDYRAGLVPEFHALRPLTVVLTGPDWLLHQTAEALFADLPCDLSVVVLPQRIRQFTDDDVDVQRTAAAVHEAGAHLGVIVDEDARRCGVVDEAGEPVQPERLLRFLRAPASGAQRDSAEVAQNLSEKSHSPSRIAGAPDANASGEGQHPLSGPAGPTPPEGRVDFKSRPQDHTPRQIADNVFAFHHENTICDALLTVARVLAAMSRSDRSLSEQVRQCAPDEVSDADFLAEFRREK